MEKKEQNLIKSGIKLSFLTLISRILGVIRETTKAHFLGTSGLADAFGVAFLIPNLLRRLFAENSISVAFIPTLRGYIEDNRDKKETQTFINSTFTLITFCTTLIVVIGFIFTPYIVRLFFDQTSDVIIAETTILTKIMYPYLIVISIAALFQGILNTLNIFAPSGFTPILFNICVIFGTYILSSKVENPARAMSIGVIIGGCLQALFQLPFILKTNWKVSFTSLKNAFTNEGTKKVISLIIPTILGMATYQLNDLVSTALAGRAETGVVSSLQYSLRLQELILGIFAVTIGTIILPDLAGLAKKKNWEEYQKMLATSIKIITLICVPITFYSLLTGKEIISLVFKSNAFDDNSVAMTLNVFIFHIAGLVFIALNRIISPAFYAQGNTKLPTLAGIISLGFNILFAFILSFKFKGPGIAFALSFSSLINTIFLFVFMKKLNTINTKSLIVSSVLYLIKIIFLSAIASIPIIFLYPAIVESFLNYSKIIRYGIPLLISCILFFSIGIILLFISKDEILYSILKKLKIKK